MKKWLLIFCSLLLLLGGAMLFLQSNRGKAWILALLAHELSKAGVQIQVERVISALPHAIAWEGVVMKSDTVQVSVQSLQARLSLLGLLQREVLFSDVIAAGIAWDAAQNPIKPHMRFAPTLPLTLKVEHFHISEIAIPQIAQTQFEGSFEMGKGGETLFLQLTATKANLADSMAKITVKLHKGGSLRAKGSLNTSSLSLLSIQLPFEAASAVQFSLKGLWHGFGQPLTKIKGTASATITPQIPFLHTPWKLHADFQQEKTGDWQIPHFSALTAYFTAKGTAVFSPEAHLKQASAQVTAHHPEMSAYFRVASMQNGDLHVDGSASLPFFAVDGLRLEESKAHIDATYRASQWTGKIDTTASLNKTLWHAFSEFAWSPNGSLFLSPLHLESPSTRCESTLEIRPDRKIIGHTDLAIENLQEFPFNFYGSLKAKADWDVIDQTQFVKLDGAISSLYWKELFSETLSFYLDLKDPFEQRLGTLSLAAEQVRWHSLFLDTLSLETAKDGADQWPFSLSLEGEWEHPLTLHLNGTFQDPGLYTLNDLSGSFYQHSLSLGSAVTCHISPNDLRLSNLDLIVGSAHLLLNLHKNNESASIDLSLMHFPLDLLSLNPLELTINGTTDAILKLSQSKENTTGSWKASIDSIQVGSLLETSILEASGLVEGKIQQERLTCHGALQTGEAPFLSLDLDVPLRLDLYPPRAQLLYDEPAQGNLSFQGRIEEMLDFFNLGTHRIEGDLVCDLTLKGSLNHPQTRGTLHFDNGYYENYLTGTQLFSIKAEGEALEGRFLLSSLTATDSEGQGQLQAKGEISLNLQEQLPFHFTADFNHLHSVQIDLVHAETEGTIQLTGNLQEALASGQMTVVQSTFTIPDHIPRSLPTLAVVYKNPTKPLAPIPFSTSAPFPLQLDLEVIAPDSISISGRGLHSQWKGAFHIGGEYTSIAAKGKLELIQGQFAFAGRSFKLIDGALSFSGREHQMPYLDLAGLMEVKGVSITARLKGPLNNPQLTLQSSPPLPLSSLMAYLLFGQELSEINSFQALQLANSLANLSGESPDVLESTRKSLGVDKLQIVSVPGDDDEAGSDTIALQVGKYISEGILVSYTQGAEDASGNLSIEIELQNGLVIQLESDQRQEQGKFTFKWNHNY
ncbi:MAG: translocation/assembly module TamB [Chlamydiia bacterium]|nr:translocation/assembly module TamB [Chlamydiia bacterium]